MVSSAGNGEVCWEWWAVLGMVISAGNGELCWGLLPDSHMYEQSTNYISLIKHSPTVQDAFWPNQALSAALGWLAMGDGDCMLVISCTECSQVAGLIQKWVETPQKHHLFMQLFFVQLFFTQLFFAQLCHHQPHIIWLTTHWSEYATMAVYHIATVIVWKLNWSLTSFSLPGLPWAVVKIYQITEENVSSWHLIMPTPLLSRNTGGAHEHAQNCVVGSWKEGILVSKLPYISILIICEVIYDDTVTSELPHKTVAYTVFLLLWNLRLIHIVLNGQW